MPGNLQSVPPASVIASWPEPNYVDPVQRTWMPAYSGTLQAVMTIMVGLRLWLRARHQAGSLGLDDAFLVPAFLAATMFTVLIMLSCLRYGIDRHIWDVPPANFVNLTLMTWLSEVAFLISTCCTKVSVLLFYRRLVQGTFSKRWKMATIGAVIFTLLYGVAFILTLVLDCRPTEAYWKSFSPTYTQHYSCTDTTSLNPVSGVLSVVSDFYSVVLPMAMMWHFEMDLRKKIALNAIFSLGLIVVGAGAARTYYLTKLGTGYDITWIGFDVIIWSDLETQLAIICASAPVLRVFFRRYLRGPISRVVNTAGSSLNRSGMGSANRHSRQLDPGAPVTYHSQPRDSADWSGTGDKSLIKHSIKPSLETVGEHEISSSPSTAPSMSYVIRTPADFEAYALQNLENNRPPRRPKYARNPSNSDMKSTLSEPFTSWHSPPRSWLDTDDKD